MARPDKAQITYNVDTAETVLRFHSVVTEEHEVSTEITKYPAMTGFDVSTHAVKKNRRVTIQGLISNHLVIGSEEFHEYGGKNTSIVFDTLKEPVRQAVPCEVLTNLGSYTPVIFTKFKTKQQAGSTDIMDFTITGEEIQLGGGTNSTAPTLLVFTPLTGEERATRVAELLEAGLEVADEDVVSVSQVDMNESFQLETIGTNGKKFITTYQRDSYDYTSKVYSHLIHTGDISVAPSATESFSFNFNALLAGDLD